MKHGEGVVTPRTAADGTVRYQCRWIELLPDGSQSRRARTFDTRDAAEDHLRDIARAKRDGRFAPVSRLTIDALIDESLERSSSRLSSRTILTYRQRARKMISPHLGSRIARDLTPLDVQRWVDQLNRAGYRASTVHAAVAVLYTVLRDARMLGIVERNAADGVRRPGITRKKITTWSEAEARRMLAVVRDDPIFGALYHVALATGMRPGELRALAWADVDMQRGQIVVRRTITKGPDGAEMIGTGTKTHRVRAVAVTDALLDVLKRHRTRQNERRLRAEAWQDLDLVFDRGDGHWLYQSQWQRFHVDACERAGVPRIRAHDIRHTSASLELEAGTHPKVVSERLGHASIEMTLDMYSHVGADLQRSAADALASRLFGVENDNIDAGT